MNVANRAARLSIVPRHRTALQIEQLLIIATILLAEPLTNAIIRSFTDASNSTDTDTNLNDGEEPETNPALYSQLLESSLFFAKAVTVYHWGHLSDRLGRRPILLIGTLGLGIATCILGSTNSPWAQTAARSMQGVFGGNSETAKAVIAEITTTDNRYKAYATLPLMQSTGLSVGSMIGNLLIGLDKTFPILDHLYFVLGHPLFIPCVVASLFSFFAFYVIYHEFHETLPSEFQTDWKSLWSSKHKVTSTATTVTPIDSESSNLIRSTQGMNYGAVDAENDATDPRHGIEHNVRDIPIDASQERKLIGPKLTAALINYSFISFLDQSQQTLLPSMYTSPMDAYGLGLSPTEMAEIMVKWGIYNVAIQMLVFPWLLQRYGPKKVYATCLSFTVIFFALFPVAHFTAKTLGTIGPAVWGIITVQMGICSLLYMAYGCTQIFIMDAAPDKSSLGSVNGIGQSVGSTARMFAPLFVILARLVSPQEQWFSGYLVYLLLLCVTMLGTMMSALLPREEEAHDEGV